MDALRVLMNKNTGSKICSHEGVGGGGISFLHVCILSILNIGFVSCCSKEEGGVRVSLQRSGSE